VATLTARLEGAEADLAAAKKAKAKPKAKPKSRTTRRRTTGARTAKPATRRRPAASRADGTLNVNEATFEELRGLGLSVTQSARLIAYRDVRGGFKSLDELDDIPGLPEATKKDLRDQLNLG
jgi:competence protein ComEA